MGPKRFAVSLTVLGGWARLASWCVALWLAHRPWGELGGIVSEPARWMERTVLGTALVVGGWVGAEGAARVRRRGRFRHAALTIPAACTAPALMALSIAGRHVAVGITFIGLLAYTAAFDVLFDALPRTRSLTTKEGDRFIFDQNEKNEEGTDLFS